MISNPNGGWCTFKLGTFEGHPSYLTDVPIDLLDAFLMYHHRGTGIAYFDEEGGARFTLVITPCSLFIIEEKDKSVLYDLSEMKIEDLEKELISDIESNLTAWADFMISDSFENNIQYIRQNIRKLKIMRRKYESKTNC